MDKLLVICGLTATGKTDLAISLAKQFNGELINTDSRQVYKGMDIITGKDIDKKQELRVKNQELGINIKKFSVGYKLKDDIPIWLVDIIEPNYPFNIGEFRSLALTVIGNIWLRGKLPIVVGGSGLYIKSITDPMDRIIIPPDNKLRSKLEGLDVERLQKMLTELDQKRWELMNHSDRNNPRRLIRSIEIEMFMKSRPTQILKFSLFKADSILFVGLKTPLKYLLSFIDKRVKDRVKAGVVAEVKRLMKKGYSWNLPALSATGCKYLKEYIEGKNDWRGTIKSWKFQEHEYAKRQMVWFNKEKRIKWFNLRDPKSKEKIEQEVRIWYTT